MCKIENKKIVLGVFKLMFNEKLIGNAVCSYEYDTIREGFRNLLKINLDILYPPKRAKTPIYKCIEDEVECIENLSQSLYLINNYLKVEYLGTQIITAETIFEFNYVSKIDDKIRLTLNESTKATYEIANLKNGKYLTLSDITEKEAINHAYKNLI